MRHEHELNTNVDGNDDAEDATITLFFFHTSLTSRFAFYFYFFCGRITTMAHCNSNNNNTACVLYLIDIFRNVPRKTMENKNSEQYKEDRYIRFFSPFISIPLNGTIGVWNSIVKHVSFEQTKWKTK